jgi:flavin-binding protein dodecin
MSDHVYKSVELTGTSGGSLQGAIENAIARANETIRNIRWFEVMQTRGMVENGKIARWQVTMKVGFTLES